jgi:hypothetical protein
VVDPVSSADRVRTLRWVKLGTILLVGLSTGLVSVQGGATTGLIAGSVLAGLLVGGALVWYLFPDADSIAPAARGREDR